MTSMARAKPPGAAARRAAGWLHLAAAPSFAGMALVTALGEGPADAICGGGPLGGMTVMYLLMSAFHAAPWLTLGVSRGRGVRASEVRVDADPSGGRAACCRPDIPG